MGENSDSLINNDSKNYPRNTPLALVVGAAGFLGSNLVEKLLEKSIQVVGIDNLSTGKRVYLEKASKDKNFHLIITPAQELELDLPRLDYIFITVDKHFNLEKVLEIFKKYKSKLVFVSSIELYDQDIKNDLEWLKSAEKQIAKFAAEHNLNARIVRLSAIFGSRMHFRVDDPAIKLIQAALLRELQKESITLEFSTRALFVVDAADLIMKSMFTGSTAQKIFDGARLSPIKVTDLKQLLMDPDWYENKGFEIAELPPWTTPNLEKTVKHLNWKPNSNLIFSLRETISYFRDNDIEVPQLREQEEKSYLQKYHIEHSNDPLSQEEDKVVEKGEVKKKKVKSKISSATIFLSLFSLIIYSLIWPFFSVGWGVLTFKNNLAKAAESLNKGDFDKSSDYVKAAEESINQVEVFLKILEPIEKSNLFKEDFLAVNQSLDLAKLSTQASNHTISGIFYLYQGLKEVTGEKTSLPEDSFKKAQLELASADEQFSKAEALIESKGYKERIEGLQNRLKNYSELVKKARAASFILPQIIAFEGKKDYLVILQNNNELRPTGGFIGSVAKISFEGGKLKKLDVSDVYAIDGQLKIHVEPPKEIKEDLNLNDWFLRDANWEPDFPTSARQIEWFYNQETGERVEGVIALNLSAIENLLKVIGILDLADYKEKISSENLFSKSITYAESGFFPGSQAKKSFLSALSTQLFNKLFFLPNQNWPGVVSELGKSMEEKHLMVYLDNPQLFSYLASQNWAGILPRAGEEREGVYQDFLFPVEANLGVNKANYYLDRSYMLDTMIGKEGEITHRLRIKYVNKSPSDAFPAGSYKNRLRIYLPLGTKLNRALWGEEDITSDVSAFVDYGRTGYSLALKLDPKQERVLVLDYQVPRNLSFKGGVGEYQLNIIKQSGTLKDPLEWKLSYPINYTLTSQKNGAIVPQELTISTDLVTDRLLKAEFSK